MKNNNSVDERVGDKLAVKQLRSDVTRFIELCKQHEIELAFGSTASWDQLLKLDSSVQEDIAKHFRDYLETCEKTVHEGFPINETKKVLWNHCLRSGLRPCSDLFNVIEEHDVLEVYSPNSIQIFRNMNFFKVSSYGVTDLLFNPFPELYHRPAEIAKLVVKDAQKIFSNMTQGTLLSTIPIHLCHELKSPRMYSSRIEVKAFSPLYDKHGAVSQMVSIIRVDLLDRRTMI